MSYPTPLTPHLIPQAVELDRRWFGDQGVSAEELTTLITRYPDSALALVEGDTLHGFATFEILDHRLPTDFVGEFSSPPAPTMPLRIGLPTPHCWLPLRSERQLDVRELAEALDAHHPYSKEQNKDFDEFGFPHLAWQAPDGGRVDE